jgi:hypothetical protein
MSLYDLLCLTIEKIIDIKLCAPPTKSLIVPYLCKQAYCDFFYVMFVGDFTNNIMVTIPENNDRNIYEKNIINKVFADSNLLKYNGIFSLLGSHREALMNCEHMSSKNIINLTKLCSVILEKYNCKNIKHQPKNIQKYWIIFHLLPIYFEITTGCFNIFNIDKKNNIITLINKLLNNMLAVNSIPHFLEVMMYVQNNTIDDNILFNILKIHYNKITAKHKITKQNINTIIQTEPFMSIIYSSDPIKLINISPDKHKTYQKSIPKTVKILVWNKYVGKEHGVGKCYVCSESIDSKHFECGHIQAKSQGGHENIDNLRPVCSVCNKSIGSTNMNKFKRQYIKKNE